jgi:hypothetical protein
MSGMIMVIKVRFCLLGERDEIVDYHGIEESQDEP